MKKYIITAVSVCLFIGLVLFFYDYFGSRVTQESHLDSVNWLPATATDISYYRRGGFSPIDFYECTIPEKDFKLLAERKNWKIVPRRSVYVSFSALVSKVPLWTSEKAELNFEPKAYFYKKDGTTVIYDRKSNRLFYYSDD